MIKYRIELIAALPSLGGDDAQKDFEKFLATLELGWTRFNTVGGCAPWPDEAGTVYVLYVSLTEDNALTLAQKLAHQLRVTFRQEAVCLAVSPVHFVLIDREGGL
jgi:hypothetical protein